MNHIRWTHEVQIYRMNSTWNCRGLTSLITSTLRYLYPYSKITDLPYFISVHRLFTVSSLIFWNNRFNEQWELLFQQSLSTKGRRIDSRFLIIEKGAEKANAAWESKHRCRKRMKKSMHLHRSSRFHLQKWSLKCKTNIFRNKVTRIGLLCCYVRCGRNCVQNLRSYVTLSSIFSLFS